MRMEFRRILCVIVIFLGVAESRTKIDFMNNLLQNREEISPQGRESILKRLSDLPENNDGPLARLHLDFSPDSHIQLEAPCGNEQCNGYDLVVCEIRCQMEHRRSNELNDCQEVCANMYIECILYQCGK